MSAIEEYWEDRYDVGIEHHSNQNYLISNDFIVKLLEGSFEKTNDVLMSIKSLFEFGCGTGELCNFINLVYKNIEKIHGYDISKNAIINAQKKYSNENVSFFSENIINENFDKKYDCFITSNTLEHFKDPISAIDSLFQHATYGIILVPYKQPCNERYDGEGGAGHVFTFDENVFSKYNILEYSTFKTLGWNYSTSGEEPLQLLILISQKK